MENRCNGLWDLQRCSLPKGITPEFVAEIPAIPGSIVPLNLTLNDQRLPESSPVVPIHGLAPSFIYRTHNGWLNGLPARCTPWVIGGLGC